MTDDFGMYVRTETGLAPVATLPGPEGPEGPAGDGLPSGGLPALASNLLNNPTFKNGLTDWEMPTSAKPNVVTTVTADASAGTATVVANAAAGNTGGLLFRTLGGAGALPVTSGKSYKAFADLTINAGNNNQIGIRIEFWNSANNSVGSFSSSTAASSGRIEVIGLAPASAVRANVNFISSSTVSDANFTVTKVMLTDDLEQQAYFDGGTPGARWMGTAHASRSELQFTRADDLDVFKTKKSTQRGFNRYTSEPESWAMPFNPSGIQSSLTGALQIGFNVDPAHSIMIDVDVDLYSYSPHFRTTLHASVYAQNNGALVGRQARVQSNLPLGSTQPWVYPKVTWIRSPDRKRLYLIIGNVTDVLGYPEAVVRRVSARYGAQGILSDPDYTFITTLPGGDAGTCAVIDDWGVYRGTGSPEGVVTAPIGSEYVDGSATNGAVKWTKLTGTGTTGWRVTTGDTGWRKISIVTPQVNGSLWLRRVNDTVYASAEQVPANADALVVGAAPASPENIYSLPTGFQGGPGAGQGSGNAAPRLAYGVGGGSPSRMMVVSGTISLWSLTSGVSVTFSTNWLTNQSWPSTLPGVAA